MSIKPPVPLEIRSAEDQVYEVLREQIVNGLTPMSPLRLSEIARSLSVSTMPVRVALRRLESESLVVTLPRRGSRVAPLRVADLEEIQTMRIRLEGLAARLGAPRVDDNGIARMGRYLKVIDRAVKKKDVDTYVSNLREFELVCYEAAGWPRLLRLIEELRRAAERYLRIAIAGGGEEVLTPRFWERFYDAVSRHDGEKAESALVDALTWTLNWVRDHLDQTPADLDGGANRRPDGR